MVKSNKIRIYTTRYSFGTDRMPYDDRAVHFRGYFTQVMDNGENGLITRKVMAGWPSAAIAKEMVPKWDSHLGAYDYAWGLVEHTVDPSYLPSCQILKQIVRD